MPDRPNPLKDQLPAGARKVGQPQPGGHPGAPVKIAGDPGSPCLISYPSASVPLVGTVGGGCILSKTNVRAMVGGLLIGAGGILVLGAAAVLAASGFRHTGAAKALGVEKVPGVRQVTRAAGARRAAGATADARAERQLGQPRENASLRVGRGAVRETPAGTRRRKAELGTGGNPASREETGY